MASASAASILPRSSSDADGSDGLGVREAQRKRVSQPIHRMPVRIQRPANFRAINPACSPYFQNSVPQRTVCIVHSVFGPWGEPMTVPTLTPSTKLSKLVGPEGSRTPPFNAPEFDSLTFQPNKAYFISSSPSGCSTLNTLVGLTSTHRFDAVSLHFR